MKKALLAVLSFLLITQLLAGLAIVAVTLVLKIDIVDGPPPTLLGVMLILTYMLATLVCWKVLKVLEIPATFRTTGIKWGWALVAIVASVFGIMAGDLLSEQMNLPNLIENMVLDMAYNNWGILAIAVLGPIVEELIFREGVCGNLIRNGMNPWKAIWISSILFGLIHFNPAQVPFAILMGIILGMIYVKTGNIVVTSIIHILNNSFAIVLVRVLGDDAKDFSLTEWIGGNWIAGVCIIAGFSLCFYLIRMFWESNPTLALPEGEGELLTPNPTQRGREIR